MAYSRQDKLKTLFKKLTADFLKREAAPGGLVTVSDFTIAKDAKNATALLTIFPEEKEAEMLAGVKKKEKELRAYVSAHTKTKFIPSIIFAIDKGEKNRQKIEELLQNT